MTYNYRLFFLLASFLLLCTAGVGQVNSLSGQNLASINIDNVPDEEIQGYYSKAKENGFTDQSMYRLLLEKGMPQAEINKLESRIAGLNTKSVSTSEANINDSPPAAINSGNRYYNQDAGNVPMQQVKHNLAIFGSELFTSNSLVFEPNLRIPTPTGYILGPDDELVINVFGYSEKTYNVTVSEEGSIYIPQVGPLFVNGLSIEEAGARIRSKLAATIYRAINTGETRVQLSLGKIRSIRVTVIGEAKKPGTSTVSSLTTLFNLLYLCGGPSDLGSYRKIELIRGNQLRRTVDLYAFLLKGDQKDNVLLQEGDVVRIPYYKSRVILNGNVKRKGKYELVEGETFDQVLAFSGGFTDDAYKAAVTIYQLTATEKRIIDLADNRYQSYQPQSSDSIVVGKLLDEYENKLTINGAVMRPGEYALSSETGLKDLIEKAGGVKEDVYTRRGSISRMNKDKTPLQVSFDVDSVMKGYSNIPLVKNDMVILYSIFDLKNENEISIDGFIKRPGKYQWAQNISLRDLILMAGGLTIPGDISNIEIARVVSNTDFNAKNYQQAEILNVDLSDSSATSDVILRPFDIVNIRQQPGYSTRRTVFLEGEVNNPGRYTLKMSGDKISNIILRAGGFKPNADSSALIIRRIIKPNQAIEDRERTFSKLLKIGQDSINTSENIRREIFKDYENISIDLNKAMQDGGSAENMVLEDGDIITVEKNTNLVKVSGEVYFPTIIPYRKKASLKYYLEKSGSFTPLARKRGTLIIYPDGKAKKVKNFLFFKTYPEVVSRSEIFVPQKSVANKARITVGEWAVVLSSLAIIANVIINLKN